MRMVSRMEKRSIKIYQKDETLVRLADWLNKMALLSCWAALFLDIAYFAVTGHALRTILFALYTPLRYFFFDISPKKELRRPPSLDRAIPLAIFINYLNKRFPIPQGGIIATLYGLALAAGRASINGYALLWFDTFYFLYEVRKDAIGQIGSNELSLKKNDQLENLRYQLLRANDEDEEEAIKKSLNNWKQTQLASQLDVWNFPIRRYLNATNDYVKLKEVGTKYFEDYPTSVPSLQNKPVDNRNGKAKSSNQNRKTINSGTNKK